MATPPIVVVGALVLLALSRAQTILPITGYSTFSQTFSTSTSQNVYFALDAEPCSQTSCTAGSCSHLYCGTDSTGACLNGVDETFTVGLQLSLNIVCCTGTDPSTCGIPASCGGNIALTGTQIQPLSTGSLSLTGKYGTCGQIPSANPGWMAVGTVSAASIQAVCSNSGPLKPYWMPLVGQPTFSQCQLPNSAVQLSITNSNNVFDALYFDVGLGFGSSPPATVSPIDNGPSAGVVQSPYNCASISGAAPAPSVNPAYSACAGTCGCYFIDLLNRTYTGGTSPTTTFWFEVCVLCNAGFSYLALCSASQGSTIITSLGGSTTYTGSLCTYQIGTGSGSLTGCTTIKYQNSQCSTPFLGGACDIFPITLAGDVSDYTFQFFGHAGSGTTLYPVNINTGTCTCGTNCAVPTTPPPTTPPPTTPPPTTPTPTTPAPTTPPTTQPPPTTMFPNETFPPTTTPAPTTSAPPTTTPTPTTPAPTTTPPPTTVPPPTTANGCLKGSNLCTSGNGGTCDVCCYPQGGAIVAWCVPDGSGGYTLDLVPSGQSPPSGAFPTNSTATDGSGYNVDCACNKIVVACPPCIGTSCLCNSATGACYSDAVCTVTPAPTTVGQTCAACPVDADGLTCGGNGLCQCGTCACSSTPINGVVYSGPACNVPQGCGAYDTCLACLADTSCVWCNLGGSPVCASDATCTNLHGYSEQCNGLVTVVQPACPNNCTCSGVAEGTCTISQGITQCQCNSGQHGTDCCASGGLSTAAKAGIAAGVIAGIVLAAIVGAAVLGFGVKKGVDWVQLRNMNMAAAQDNPTFKPQTEERENPLHVEKGVDV